MAKKKEEKIKQNYNREVIDLKEFMLLDAKKQDEKIKETLDIMYEGNLTVTKKHIEKVLNICFDPKDNEVYLPASLKVEKNGSKLIFYFHKRNNIGLILLFLLAFLFIGGFATYTGVQYLGRLQMNQDLDGDGVADLNIDLDGDGICDINCDTDKDGKPDRNIDYNGNRKPIFNVQMDDGTIFNPINQDTDSDGKCDINCDTNDDGWPDTNIDLDGDGKPDINIDTNNDGVADVNIDTNGDGNPDVNIDSNNDGVCDRNCVSPSTQNKGELDIDTDGDGICDVNCDTDGDGKPDTNLDYWGDKNPTFNVEDEDGNIDNPTNQDTDGDGVCDINCDINDDGWPDTNIDLDGDGKPDVNIDTNDDGIPDLNIDTDGDKEPDMNVDTDGDGVCDENCASIVTDDGTTDGIYQEGDDDLDFNTASLIVIFESQNNVVADNIYPDDQVGQGVNTSIPDLLFTVQNMTNQTIYYDLSWVVNENTFESTNFWYRVVSDNNGFNQNWTTAPKADSLFANRVAIAPNVTQTYRISFTLHGTGEEQNYDQGKIFDGQVSINLIEE